MNFQDHSAKARLHVLTFDMPIVLVGCFAVDVPHSLMRPDGCVVERFGLVCCCADGKVPKTREANAQPHVSSLEKQL